MEFDSIIYSINGEKILRGVYLKVSKGSIVGVFGENGSGKSTLLKIAAGILTPKEGNIFINKQYIDKNLSLTRYKYLAYLSQESFLPNDLSIAHFIKEIPKLENVVQKDAVLNKLKNQKVITLSGGELRYLEIQILFCLDREYYILDEPFTGIEPYFIEKISEILLYQKKLGKGILITDHYHRYVTEIVDSGYLLKNGYMEKIGNKTNIRDDLIAKGYIQNR